MTEVITLPNPRPDDAIVFLQPFFASEALEVGGRALPTGTTPRRSNSLRLCVRVYSLLQVTRWFARKAVTSEFV